MGGAILRRRDRLVVALVALVAAPVLAASPSPCPDGATMQAQGTGYHCVRAGQDGRMQRHGWAVLHHPGSSSKHEECEYRDGVRHGRCSFFDENGALLGRGSYERGARAGAWWFWSIPVAEGRRGSLSLTLGEPDAAARRRGDVQSFLAGLGADPAEATALAEALLNYIDRDGVERRQVCGDHLCLGPGRIPGEPIFVGFAPLPVQVERDRKLVAAYTASARKRVRDEERAAKAELARIAAEQRRQARDEASRAAREAREEAQERGPEERACCKYCSSGQPCGDSCISWNKTCRKGRGCAC